MKREPVLTVASITSLVAAVLSLLVAFGLQLNGDQQTAILGVAAIVAPIIVALFSRPRVTPVAPVARNQVGESVVFLIAGVLVILILAVVLLRLV
jgi:hypothetical protein